MEIEITARIPSFDDEHYVDEITDTIARKLEERWRKKIDERLEEVAEGLFAERVTAALERLIAEQLEKPITITDRYGKALKTATLRELFDQQVVEWLEQKVDYNGKPIERNGYGWDSSTPRTAWIVRKAVEASGSEKLTEAAKKAAAEIRAQLEAHIATATQDILRRLLGISG